MSVACCLRAFLFGIWIHLKLSSRSALQITFTVLTPIMYATLALFMFEQGGHADALLRAALGAGLLGMWISVLFGSGFAIQNQRWKGTLEPLVMSPMPFPIVVGSITVATTLIGIYSMVAALLWGVVAFDVPLTMTHPGLFVVAVLLCVISLGSMGLLIASTFALMRSANALANMLDHPIALLSGMIVPFTVLPSWLHVFSWSLPVSWSSLALHSTTTGSATTVEVVRTMVIAIVVSVIYVALATLAFRVVEVRTRRAATLTLT